MALSFKDVTGRSQGTGNNQADVKLSERPGEGEAIAGSAAEYAPYVNFGTRNQQAQPFLSTAGEIVARKAIGTITTEMQKAMYKGLRKSFNKQRKGNVEVTTYGNPIEANVDGNKFSVLQLAVGITSQAKALCPVDQGYLRNSIMWRTEDKEGGLNVR